MSLTHVDKNGMPTMVDVAEKAPTPRVAIAQSEVQLPPEMRPYISENEIVVKKGPVFQTAVIAGTMAAKRTHELIPFCHQIPVESCKFEISVNDLLVRIVCTVKTTYKTGVEMEALHGATVAALTIYDMCKALSHNIVLRETRLLSKTGGKSTALARPLYGLVLTGGYSKRMKKDKALIDYHGRPHALYLYDLLARYCTDVYLSARKDQWAGTALEGLKVIEDLYEDAGPMAGILSAFAKHPFANWLIVACDLPNFNSAAIEKLLAHVNDQGVATCFKNSDKGFPEALCALYTPSAGPVFQEAFASGERCPVDVLKRSSCQLLEASDSIDLANVNTQAELFEVQNEIG